MGERAQASVDLQALSDASLRVEVERGNEAARALLLSRRLASLSSHLSRLGTHSDVVEVHIRLDIIDAILADLVGERLAGEEAAAPVQTPSGIDEQSWRAFLGPLLTEEEVARLLRLGSLDEIDDLIARGKVLALPISNGTMAFPEFQFQSDGAVAPIIEPVVAIFQNVVTTPYTIASWLRGPKDYLNGKSPMQWLEGGGDSEPVIAGAERAAAQLGQ